jgi:very-short-patch-repair endonuclease
VGRSQFKIDIAVVGKSPTVTDAEDGHPAVIKPRYVLGIMCDGENYYATKTARDREVVQPTVLQGLEWKVMRVWTMDWFMNPKAVEQRIEDALKSCA